MNTQMKAIVAGILFGATLGSIPSALYYTVKNVHVRDTGLFSKEYQYANAYLENTGWGRGWTKDSELSETAKDICYILGRDKPKSEKEYRAYLTDVMGGSGKLADTLNVIVQTAVPIHCPEHLDIIKQKG